MFKKLRAEAPSPMKKFSPWRSQTNLANPPAQTKRTKDTLRKPRKSKKKEGLAPNPSSFQPMIQGAAEPQ